MLKKSHKILIFHEAFRANSAPSLDIPCPVNPGASSRLPSLEKSPAVACGARCGPYNNYTSDRGKLVSEMVQKHAHATLAGRVLSFSD